MNKHYKLQIKEFDDTKGVIRSRKSQKDRQRQWPKEKGQHDEQRSVKYYKLQITEFKYTREIIRSRKSKDRQCNGY